MALDRHVGMIGALSSAGKSVRQHVRCTLDLIAIDCHEENIACLIVFAAQLNHVSMWPTLDDISDERNSMDDLNVNTCESFSRGFAD